MISQSSAGLSRLCLAVEVLDRHDIGLLEVDLKLRLDRFEQLFCEGRLGFAERF